MARVDAFGFSTIQARDLSNLDEILRRIADTGAQCAELSLGGADLICGGRLLPTMVAKLEAICARHDLRYTVHGALSANLMEPRTLAWHKAAIAAMLEICGAIGAPVLVHHAGRIKAASAAEIEARHAMERDALRELGDIAGRHDVTIAVENLWVARPEQYTPDPARLAAELAALDHPYVAGTLDFSHAYLQTRWLGTDFAAALRAFAPQVCHLHVHDSFGRPGEFLPFASEQMAYGMGDLHLPLGWGDIPFEVLLPGLAVRPGTVFMIELPHHFGAEMAACAEAARRLMPLVGRDCGEPGK